MFSINNGLIRSHRMRPLKMNLTFLMEKCCEGHLNRHDIFLQTRDNVARHKANVTKRVTRVWNSGSFLYDLSKLISLCTHVIQAGPKRWGPNPFRSLRYF